MGEAMDENTVWSDNPLQVYLTLVGQIPPLDSAEETACIDHVRAGGQAAEAAVKRLVEAHLRLVVSLAERYRGPQIHVLDLIERGNEGLMHAVQSLTDSAPESFSAHATPFIERALAEGAVFVRTRPAHKR
jgi:DNA-directed RNA polymerase sigma subunit (sigma70/sigma32)